MKNKTEDAQPAAVPNSPAPAAPVEAAAEVIAPVPTPVGAKAKAIASAEAAPAAAASREPRIPLAEFCMRLSETEKRVALIAGFECVELKAQRVVDTATRYTQRFAAFRNKPIQ